METPSGVLIAIAAKTRSHREAPSSKLDILSRLSKKQEKEAFCLDYQMARQPQCLSKEIGYESKPFVGAIDVQFGG